MPFCEADPWRLQYFENVACPDDVRIPTEDADAYQWYPAYNWVYNKLAIAQSQGLDAGPHGVPPQRYPVFSKPMTNLKGMGVGSRILTSEDDAGKHYMPGHMWMTLLDGEHVSTDVAVVDGDARWWRHTTGKAFGDGMFDYWTIHAASRPELESYLGSWIAANLKGHTGLMNFETIGGRIIEAHMRFADQWPDLYGAGWTQAAVRLYADGDWTYADDDRRDGYSVTMFGRHGIRFRKPGADRIKAVLDLPSVTSVQIPFHEDKRPEDHAMPPGGFRVGIVNCRDLAQGLKGRAMLATAYPQGSILWPEESLAAAAGAA